MFGLLQLASIRPQSNYEERSTDTDDIKFLTTDQLLCPICQEFFHSIPRVLSCGHTLCTNCFRHLRSASNRFKVFKCPLCTNVCTGIRPNYILESIIESGNASSNDILNDDLAICDEIHSLRRQLESMRAILERREESGEKHQIADKIERVFDSMSELRSKIRIQWRGSLREMIKSFIQLIISCVLLFITTILYAIEKFL